LPVSFLVAAYLLLFLIHRRNSEHKKYRDCTKDRMQIEIIQPDSLIDLKISPSFLTRLHELLTWMITSQDAETVKAANERISKGEELEEWDEYYATLLILVNSIEEAAKEQGKTEMVEV
jgi:hypothetical protein